MTVALSTFAAFFAPIAFYRLLVRRANRKAKP